MKKSNALIVALLILLAGLLNTRTATADVSMGPYPDEAVSRNRRQARFQALPLQALLRLSRIQALLQLPWIQAVLRLSETASTL